MKIFKKESAEKKIEQLDEYYPKSDLKYTYQKHREQIMQIIYCIENIQKTKQLSDSDLKIIEDGIRNSWQVVYYYQAGNFLSELSFKQEKARQLFYKLFNDKDCKVRFNVVTILLNKPHKNIIMDILTNALTDRSKIVRLKALDVIDRLNLNKQFSKAIEQMPPTE